jgi:hypothetical protein
VTYVATVSDPDFTRPNASDRDRLLSIAAGFTADPSDTRAVTANTVPLLDWVLQGVSDADRAVRLDTLNRRRFNLISRGASFRPETPAEFMDGVDDLYAFADCGWAGK